MVEEIWRDIKGYEGKYQISSMGRVKSFYFGKERILIPNKDKGGYLYVSLSKHGKIKSLKVHRLIAEAFILNPDNKTCIDHINTIRDDNRVENLRWCTSKENSNNPLTSAKLSKKAQKQMTGKFGKKHPTSKPILQCDNNMNIIRLWYCGADVKRELGINAGAISSCCKGILKTAGGFKWRYLHDQLADWLEEIQDEDMAA